MIHIDNCPKTSHAMLSLLRVITQCTAYLCIVLSNRTIDLSIRGASERAATPGTMRNYGIEYHLHLFLICRFWLSVVFSAVCFDGVQQSIDLNDSILNAGLYFINCALKNVELLFYCFERRRISSLCENNIRNCFEHWSYFIFIPSKSNNARTILFQSPYLRVILSYYTWRI